jgi:pyrroline-5-carboxylate reductase
MAEALISRLYLFQSIIAYDVDNKRLSYLKKKYRLKAARNNWEAFNAAKIIILAVKPQNMAEALDEIGKVENGKLVISIAAGIPLSYLQKKLPGLAIVRAMPNNPCLVGMGITALARGRSVSPAQYKKAAAIFDAVGAVVEVPENLMDAVTGLSGSGPAFVYQAIEALTAGGTALKLPKKVAEKLALQTVLGAAVTVIGTGKSPAELRGMVTSPGGTTIEGLKALAKRKFSRALQEAVFAAARKSKRLSQRWTS